MVQVAEIGEAFGPLSVLPSAERNRSERYTIFIEYARILQEPTVRTHHRERLAKQEFDPEGDLRLVRHKVPRDAGKFKSI